MTCAAFLRPAGNDRPIFSSFSRKHLPPFFDLALNIKELNSNYALNMQIVHVDKTKRQADFLIQNKSYFYQHAGY